MTLCPECNSAVGPGWKFCGTCGAILDDAELAASMAGSEAAATEAARSREPRWYQGAPAGQGAPHGHLPVEDMIPVDEAGLGEEEGPPADLDEEGSPHLELGPVTTMPAAGSDGGVAPGDRDAPFEAPELLVPEPGAPEPVEHEPVEHEPVEHEPGAPEPVEHEPDAPEPVLAGEAEEPRSAGGRRRSALRGVVAVLAVAVLAVAAIAAGLEDLSQRDTVKKADAQVVVARRQLNAARADLTAARKNLDTRDRDLADTKAKLDQVTGELAAANGAQTGTQSRADTLAGQLEVLKACLRGLNDVIARARTGDSAGAGNLLNAVQPQCQAANKLL